MDFLFLLTSVEIANYIKSPETTDCEPFSSFGVSSVVQELPLQNVVFRHLSGTRGKVWKLVPLANNRKFQRTANNAFTSFSPWLRSRNLVTV